MNEPVNEPVAHVAPARGNNLAMKLASLKIGPVRYNSPWTQVALMGFVCFCSPGLFNALSGLGAGGSQDIALVDITNGVLYGLFAVTGFVAGSINNILGTRLTLCIGTMGYSIYVGGLWAFQVHGTRPFLIVSGGILGFCAALLWTAEGQVMMAYPEEKDKGRAFAVFWAIFSLGGVVGAAISLGLTYSSTAPSVSTGVYLAFLIIMLLAIFLAWTILPPQYVIRGDGTLVELQDHVSPSVEFKGFIALFKDWRMLALFPMFFMSNYYYSYQGAIVAHLFNARTRSLSSLLTNFGAIVGAILIGLVLDYAPFKRRNRAITGWAVVLFFQLLVWSAGIGFQVGFKRTDDNEDDKWDTFTDPRARGPLVLLFTMYIADATYQGLAYYTMSSLTNDPFRLARMTGYYKGVQSAGAAVSFGMDAVGTPFLTELIVNWVIMVAALIPCLIVLLTVVDTNYETEHVVHVEDIPTSELHAALPPGHHTEDEEMRHGTAGIGKGHKGSNGNGDLVRVNSAQEKAGFEHEDKAYHH